MLKIPLGQLDFLIRSRRYREMVSSMMAKHNLHEKRPELFVAGIILIHSYSKHIPVL
jgi:hypothetical protein